MIYSICIDLLWSFAISNCAVSVRTESCSWRVKIEMLELTTLPQQLIQYEIKNTCVCECAFELVCVQAHIHIHARMHMCISV